MRRSPQHRSAQAQGACHLPAAMPPRQRTAVGSAAARGSHSPASEARTTATARSDISCARCASKGTSSACSSIVSRFSAVKSAGAGSSM